MEFEIDTTGVEEKTGFKIVPEGEYAVQIVEKADKTTRNGDPMVNIKLEILGGANGGSFLWDNIVIPSGPNSSAWGIMGRTKHFLHMIEQPYEGKFKVNSDKWLWQKTKVKVKHETQKEGKYAGDLKATIAQYLPLEKESNSATEADPDIPF